jgi:AraC-like DNA-binding protein
MDSRTTIQTQLRQALEGKGLRRALYARADVPPPLYAFVVSFPSVALVLDGCYEVELAGSAGSTVCSLQAGDVLYAPANCWYRPTWKHASRTLTVLFGRKQTGFSLVSSTPRRGGPAFEVCKHHAAVKLSSLCRDLLALCDQARQPHHHDDIAIHLVHALLLSCDELLEDQPSVVRTKPRVLYESICSHVQEHFHQRLTRTSVAAAFDITPNHLSRLFRAEGLMRFWDYVTLVRLDRAKFLLIQYDIPVKAVAAHCGFVDTTYFCRVFRRRMKLTPMQYRLKYGRRRNGTSL